MGDDIPPLGTLSMWRTMTKDRRVSVDNGKYTFIAHQGTPCAILRHGEPWIDHVNSLAAIHSMMCELDAARVVVQAARIAADLPNGVHDALALHDRLTSDREPPSAWAAGEAGPQKCPRCWFTPCRRMFQCSDGVLDREIQMAPTVPAADAASPWRRDDAPRGVRCLVTTLDPMRGDRLATAARVVVASVSPDYDDAQWFSNGQPAPEPASKETL